MSFLVLHMDKFKKEAVRGIQGHNQRERKSKSNPDIDYGRSALNYDLCNQRPINFSQVINQRLDELKLKKSPRHDAVLMCGLVVSSDEAFFKNLSAREQQRFFLACKEFLEDFVGPENVISAMVHLDEKTPHLHFTHVPVTADGRLSAKAIYTRESLKRLQTALPRYLQSRGFKIERGVEQQPGSAKKHLNTREFKQQQEAEKNLAARVEGAQVQAGALENALEIKQSELEKMKKLASEAEAILNETPAPPKPGLWVSKRDYEQALKTIEIQKQALADKALVKTENEILKTRQADVDRAIAEAMAEARAEHHHQEQTSQNEKEELRRQVSALEATLKRQDESHRQFRAFTQSNLKDYQRLKALEEKQNQDQRRKELLEGQLDQQAQKQEPRPAKPQPAPKPAARPLENEERNQSPTLGR